MSNYAPTIESKHTVEDDVEGEDVIDEVESDMLDERRPTSFK